MTNRALIASNVSDFVRNFFGGYQALGYEPIAGRINFDIGAIESTIVHILWPEELVNWQTPPTDSEIDVVRQRLASWKRRSRLIFTVNNLYPHQCHGNPAFHRLYSAVLERADVIHHFGHASKSAVCAEYPSCASGNHVVRVGFNYERLLNLVPRDRDRARAALGIGDDEITFLTFGALRSWDEANLLMKAFNMANVPKKRLLLCSRLTSGGSPLSSRANLWRWNRWSSRPDITKTSGYLPDEQLPDIFDAADVVLSVRPHNLNSGIVSMAMTFGRTVIAPNCGTMAEFVSGTENPVYEAESAKSLARAMERAASADHESIGAINARIASGWGWKDIISSCLQRLPN